jgi:DnaJ domain
MKTLYVVLVLVHCSALAAAASFSISVTATVLPCALPTRGGASFQDNDKSKTTFQPDSGKKKRKKAKKTEKPSREENESTEPAKEEEAEQKETTKSSTAAQQPSPQEVLIEQLLKEDDYYAILGVSKSATAQEIQKAYRRRAVQTHPDKLPSNDRRAFDKVAEAYDVLSDENKRATYNRFGKRGLDSTAEGRSLDQILIIDNSSSHATRRSDISWKLLWKNCIVVLTEMSLSRNPVAKRCKYLLKEEWLRASPLS